jgi:hypothetical protein
MKTHLYLALITGLLLLYFIAGVWMAFRLPAHATPNELLNFEYIQVMRQIRGLPNRGLVDSEIRYTEWHQPPVYFTFAAFFGWPIPVPLSDINPPPPIEVDENPHYLSTPRGNLNPVVHTTPRSTPLLYTSRISAALLGLLGIAALYRAGKQIYRPWVGILMASLLAFQPNFIHLSGSVNNDMPLTAVVAIVMSYAILLLDRMQSHPDTRPRLRLFFILGLLGAAAILTKANGVFVLAFLGVVILGHLLIFRQWRATLAAAAVTMTGLIPLWAGWLWFNAVRMRDALGLSGSLPVGRVLRLSPIDFSHVLPFSPAIWRSYWLDWSAGDVGYGPGWLYLFWLGALVVMLLGWAKRDTHGEKRASLASISQRVALAPPRQVALIAPMVLLGFLAISYLYLAVKALTVKEAGWMVPEARWWLPGLPALAWLAAAGFARWWRAPGRQEVACLIAASIPPAILFGLLLFHLLALYPQAERLSSVPDREETIVINDDLTLAAVEVEPLFAGEVADLILTWRALRDIDTDYTISSQLVVQDPDGWRKLFEHNSYPGQGMNPTLGWRAGEVFRDRLTVLPEGALDGPTMVTVFVGAKSPDGQTEPQPVTTTVIRPADPLVTENPLAEPVTYADIVRLVAVESDEVSGQQQVTLYWEAIEKPTADASVFVHLVDGNGQLVAQADGPPNRGLSPMTMWRKGDMIRDRHTFPAGIAPAPDWRFLVGFYNTSTGERLPATQAGQPLPGDAFEIP